MDEIIDYYEVLGLENDCTNDQIKQKFKQLALKYHPDKFHQHNHLDLDQHTIEIKFKRIENAYRILLDEDTRRKFDAEFSLIKANLPIINEQITIDEFKQSNDEPNSTNYEYNCRCGGFYRLSTDQYNETLNKFKEELIASFILSCDTCSLYVRILKS